MKLALPPLAWLKLSLPLLLTLLLGSSLTLLIAAAAWQWERDLANADYQVYAQERANDWQRELDRHLEATGYIAALFSASDKVQAEEFKKFTQGPLALHDDIDLFAWLPRVDADSRTFVEASAQHDNHKEFQFREIDENGVLQPAKQRAYYYPALYVKSAPEQQAILGFDFYSHPSYKRALDESRDTGVSAILRLQDSITPSHAPLDFYVFRPVYGRHLPTNSLEQRRANLSGYIVVLFHLRDAAAGVFESQRFYPDNVTLYDRSPNGDWRVIHQRYVSKNDSWSTAALARIGMENSNPHFEAVLDVPGTDWKIILEAAPEFLTTRSYRAVWTSLLAGFLITALALFYLAHAILRTKRIERLVSDLDAGNFALTEYQRQLVVARDELENRVERRTAELEYNNRLLISENADRLQAEQALREHRDHVSAVMDNVADGIITCDERGRIESVNPAAEDLFGYKESELRGQSLARLMSGKMAQDHDQYVRNYVQGGRSQILGMNGRELEALHRDGHNFQIDLKVSEMWLAGKRRFIGLVRDISDRKRDEERLRFLANFDELTHLPNRNLFRERISHAMLLAGRNQHLLAIFFIDLDGFKRINDTLGHAAGDKLLKVVAQRLKECVRDSDTVSRRGGDEFTVLLENVETVEGVISVAQKIIDVVSESVHLGSDEVFVTASIGITLYPFDTQDVDELLKDADIAMYQAKELGKNRYQFYTADMNAQAMHRLNLESKLRRALQNDEFELHYQPQVNLYTGDIVGMEALIRWRSPEQGLVAPGEFIQLLESTGLIVPVGEYVLREACQQQLQWLQQGFNYFKMAVNISARQFDDPDFTSRVADLLEETGLDSKHLEVEVTESAVMHDTKASILRLEELRALGLSIAIDDFGTGYSSLAYLQQFPVSKIKIDRSFISELANRPDDRIITQAIISMAHALRTKVVAEGIEDSIQVSMLATQGCDTGQGYFFSRPLPADEVTKLLEAEARPAHKKQRSAS